MYVKEFIRRLEQLLPGLPGNEAISKTDLQNVTPQEARHIVHVVLRGLRDQQDLPPDKVAILKQEAEKVLQFYGEQE
jgi:hypothetical protein